MKPVPSEFLSLLVLGPNLISIKNAEEIGPDAHSLKIGGLTLIAVKVREPLGNECLGRASVGYAYLLINCPLGVRSETNFFGERGEKWSIHLVTLPSFSVA